jgi:hypothetical protein
MPFKFLAALLLSFIVASGADAKRLRFSGYDFKIKQGSGMGPGPNDWAPSQAFVDGKGRLHLRFSEKNGKWVAGEIQSVSRLGFGTYEIEFEGDIDGQDKNVVFGFFNYPPSDVGSDATHEIDIEFARWGRSTNKPLNYTVWPVNPELKNAHKSVAFRTSPGRSLHRFTWKADSVEYFSQEIFDGGGTGRETHWTFSPGNPADRISTQPMPIYFNLWGFQGRTPSDNKPVEVIVRRFKFTPADE